MPEYTGKVAAVVIPYSDSEEKFLIAKRSDNNEWEFPGGKEDLEKDQNILDTAEREIMEELNIEVNASKYRKNHSFKGGGYDIIPVHASHEYSNPDREIELVDHTDYRWINPRESSLDLDNEIRCLEAFGIL